MVAILNAKPMKRLLAAASATVLALGGAGLAYSHDEAPGSFRMAGAKPSRPGRTQLLGHANPGGYSADVFGYRGHAYLSSWGRRNHCPSLGVRVFSLRNPRRPSRVGTFADGRSEPDVRGSWTEKTIVKRVRTPRFTGDLAVTSLQSCTDDGFQGFGLYDVVNPARPRRLALVRLEPRGSHEIWLAAHRNRAYVYTAVINSELVSSPSFDPRTRDASTPGKADFRIFDVSDPERPREVGEWGAWRELGVKPTAGRGRFTRGNFVHSVITNAQLTRAYLSYWDLGTVILDIGDPARPRYLGRTPAVDDEGDAHSAALARGGRILIETHENASGRPYFFDISNPRRPRLVGKFGPYTPGGEGFATGVHDAKVIGNRAYFSWYSRGVLVADISNPRKPRLVARFVPTRTADPVGGTCETPCTLTWGVYATRGYVLASDIVSGLWVFRIR
ncbi:MAG: hypothetical protein M3322_00255 [Actinomycetota bacterium]|nr:hypothetical protein [Actinomycetota bacterium]